jgi:hypothetical protein
MTDVTVPPEKPVSRAAIRMARSRARRRRHQDPPPTGLFLGKMATTP